MKPGWREELAERVGDEDEEETRRQAADLTPELLERLPAWSRVPHSALSPSIITACYPS